jgi:hypothetical protein
MGEERSREAGPSRAAVIGWAAAMLVVPAVTWYLVTIAVPGYQAHRAIRRDRTELQVGIFGDLYGSQNVVNVLGGPEPALRKLRAYLKLPRVLASYRGEAICHLGRCGSQALPHIVAFLNDRDPKARTQALLALEQSESPRALELLEPMIDDPDLECRCTAAGVLARQPLTPASAPLLERVMLDDSEGMRDLIFGQMRYGVHGGRKREVLIVLRKMAGHHDARVHRTARFWLECVETE